MSSDLVALLKSNRIANALSARQVARLAGVSPSTVTRVEDGTMDPSFSVAMRLLDAVGIDQRLQRISSPSAIATARWLLGDVDQRPDDADRWTKRWLTVGAVRRDEASVVVTDPRQLAFRAGKSASIVDRPGVALLRQDRSWSEIASGLTENGLIWAATGDRAANRLAASASETTPTFYVNDVASTVSRLDLRYRDPGEWGQPIVLVPFDGTSEHGRWQDTDGTWYAASWQVVMDCYSGGDRQPEQADAAIDSLLVTADA